MNGKNYKCVGLIIKNRSLAVVEVESKKGIPVVTNYAKVVLEEGIVENDCFILNKEGFQEAIKKLFSDGVGGPIKTKFLHVSLSEEKVFSHQITVFKDKVNDAEYIKEVAKDYVPIELNQAVFDYKIVHENPNQKTVTINFVATQDRIVKPLLETLREIGIEVTAINVDIYCLIKSFHNSLNKGEGSYLLVNMEPSRDLLAVVSADDHVFDIVSKNTQREIIDRLKALLNLSTEEEVKQLLINTRSGKGLNEAQIPIVKNAFQEYMADLSKKINQLIGMAQASETIEIKRVYLTGLFSGLLGAEEMLSSLLPEVPIKKGLQFLEIPLEIEGDALEGIGLCLNGFLPDNKNNFNLLPEEKMDEIRFARISPKIKIVSFILTALLIILTLITGKSAAANYLNYQVSSREVIILNEQTLNPYITQLARTEQTLKQSRDQILLLIKDSVPVSQIIRDLDTYNSNDIEIININYDDAGSSESANISLRAKTSDRDVTEEFVSKLEASSNFERVNSPISNLVGKGERFVNISLYINKTNVIDAFETLMNEPSRSLPGKPSEETIIDEETTNE